MEQFHDAHGTQLHIGDYVRRRPQGLPGRVLDYDEETGHVQVEWPYVEGAMLEYESDLERVSSPALALNELPILEVWKTDSDAPSPDTTWEVLGKYQNIDLEMWQCRIIKPDGSEEIGDCYAAYIRMDATRLVSM